MATAGTALKRIRICEEHDPQAGGVLKGQPSTLTDAAQPVNPLPAGEASLKYFPAASSFRRPVQFQFANIPRKMVQFNLLM